MVVVVVVVLRHQQRERLVGRAEAGQAEAVRPRQQVALQTRVEVVEVNIRQWQRLVLEVPVS